MSEEISNEPLAEVIPIRLRGIERINGVVVNLGKLTAQELFELESECFDRMEASSVDHQIVHDYRSSTDGDGGAA